MPQQQPGEGTGAASVVMAAPAAPGIYTVVAAGATSGVTDSATLTVQAFESSLHQGPSISGADL